MKTADEVKKLKQDWLGDSCWDIENTEGFEDYYQELLDFRLYWEQLFKNKSEKYMKYRAEKVGLEDNRKLLEYLLSLERKIENLESKLNEVNEVLYRQL